MSARDERAALTDRPSLYAYALSLIEAGPREGPASGAVTRRQGFPLPAEPPLPDGPRLRGKKGSAAVRAALGPLLAGPDTPEAATEVHRRLAELPMHTGPVVGAVLSMPLDDPAAARALARRLVRTGTLSKPVCVGLALLRRLGEPEDIPVLRVLTHLDGLLELALTALEPLDPRTAALRRLDLRTRETDCLRPFVDALLSDGARDVRALLIGLPADLRTVGPSPARRIAEAIGLAGLLRREPVDPRLLARAARLLVRMASPRDYAAEVRSYREAVEVCELVVRRAAALPPGVDHAAVLLSLAVDLHSGATRLLPWRDGQVEQLLDAPGRVFRIRPDQGAASGACDRKAEEGVHAEHRRPTTTRRACVPDAASPARSGRHGLGALLHSPAWEGVFTDPGPEAEAELSPAVRRRAEWLRYTRDRVFLDPPPDGRLRIEVLSRDPDDGDPLETRFLLDGEPLVPAVFGRGAGNSPEYLLGDGRLRATEDPREVQLAEAWCTEGCCGALWVTVVREGDEVVWRDWRLPSLLPGGAPEPVLPAHRFDAVAYDAEVARASAETRWSWSARVTARLVKEELNARRELLGRWDCRLSYAMSPTRRPETTEVWFVYRPGTFEGTAREDGPWIQFRWELPDDGTPPAERAAAALRRLATEDPRGFAQCAGGIR
ncbi:hypothetical protein [Streptomyces fradiae]|uniref:hypothetical protein n=1 Tax=Streptomyces fradiae TaxID=1906 RepID=UPI003514760D